MYEDYAYEKTFDKRVYVNIPNCLYRHELDDEENPLEVEGVLQSTYTMPALTALSQYVIYVENMISNVRTVDGSESVLIEMMLYQAIQAISVRDLDLAMK